MALRAFLVLSTVSLSVYLFATVPGAGAASRAGDVSWDAWTAEPGAGAVRFASAALEAPAPEPSVGGRAASTERSSAAERTPARARVRALPGAELVPDSILDDLAIGRFWHVARFMREQRVAEEGPEGVLLLARAEAGWGNWPAVRRLLQDAGWLDSLSDGEGLLLLAEALEHEERWSAAADAFERYLDVAEAGIDERTAAAVHARVARALLHAGDLEGAVEEIAHVSSGTVVRSWLAADLALDAAREGDTALVARLMTSVTDEAALDATWRVEADALLAAGDTARASERLVELLDRTTRSGHDSRAAAVALDLAVIRLAAGDTASARPLFEQALDGGRSPVDVRAASVLADLGGQDLDGHVRLARMLDRAGDGRRALRSYDRAFRAAADAGVALSPGTRLERARLMATVRDRQNEALEEFRALREEVEDPDLGARNLLAWTRMRERQGLDAQVRTLRQWLLEDYPSSDAAVEIVFMRGYDADMGGRTTEALRHYAAVADVAPTHSRAGQGRMRSGQIHLGRGDLEAAARTFEAYLEDFPDGRRWEEAAYWAGRARLEMGEREAGERHLRTLLGLPDSYYAILAAELLDEPHVVDLAEGEPPVEPEWLTVGLERLDALVEARLDRGVEAEIDRLRERSAPSRAHTLALANALIERGRTIDGINLAWALRADGHPWDRELLRVAYPFPYRELVRREAEEWGVDPMTLAALIRQESAFKRDIVSRAGAIGLMQVMPPTGAQLARSHGPEDFDVSVLSTPEVNLHLGTAFFVEMSRRYDGDLPLVLSAYNAGPSRARRWREFPEVVDQPRFTERIPFVETRGYVKNVRRNIGLYRILYGQEQ